MEPAWLTKLIFSSAHELSVADSSEARAAGETFVCEIYRLKFRRILCIAVDEVIDRDDVMIDLAEKSQRLRGQCLDGDFLGSVVYILQAAHLNNRLPAPEKLAVAVEQLQLRMLDLVYAKHIVQGLKNV